MAEREVVLEEPQLFDDQAEAVRHANERAEHAEAELARLKRELAHKAPAKAETHVHPAAHDSKAGAETSSTGDPLKNPPSPNTRANAHAPAEADNGGPQAHEADGDGEAELRKDSMMAHLLDSLADGKDIGHYGRLVFAMVARHFMAHDEVVSWLTRDRDVSEEKAVLLLRQVEGKDYSPPKRDRILSYQAQQDFPILPHPDDPDCGNLYRNLKFPNEIYQHISHYQEAKLEAEE